MGLDRTKRDMPYVVGRMIAIVEHYARKEFGPLTIDKMYEHPQQGISMWEDCIDENDEYYRDIYDIKLPITMLRAADKSQAAVGYYHQKKAYYDSIPADIRAIMDALLAAREERGISLRQLNEMTGINISNLSRIERGEVSPHLDTLVTIANALGVKIEVN